MKNIKPEPKFPRGQTVLIRQCNQEIGEAIAPKERKIVGRKWDTDSRGWVYYIQYYLGSWHEHEINSTGELPMVMDEAAAFNRLLHENRKLAGVE